MEARQATKVSDSDKKILSERPIGQAALSGYRTTPDKKPDAPPRRKAIRINGLKNRTMPDNSGQMPSVLGGQ
jgi:hypothetical protein